MLHLKNQRILKRLPNEGHGGKHLTCDDLDRNRLEMLPLLASHGHDFVQKSNWRTLSRIQQRDNKRPGVSTSNKMSEGDEDQTIFKTCWTKSLLEVTCRKADSDH